METYGHEQYIEKEKYSSGRFTRSHNGMWSGYDPNHSHYPYAACPSQSVILLSHNLTILSSQSFYPFTIQLPFNFLFFPPSHFSKVF
jgi:hypothetical protein